MVVSLRSPLIDCEDACQPACSAVGGICLPSSSTNNNTSSRAFECRCAKGFSGPTCSSCAPGYFGPTCQACPRQCFDEKTGTARCDDGVTGSGGCRGVLGNSTSGEFSSWDRIRNAKASALSQRATVYVEHAHLPTRANALLAGLHLPMLLPRFLDVLSVEKGGFLTFLQGTVSVSPTCNVSHKVTLPD